MNFGIPEFRADGGYAFPTFCCCRFLSKLALKLVHDVALYKHVDVSFLPPLHLPCDFSKSLIRFVISLKSLFEFLLSDLVEIRAD